MNVFKAVAMLSLILTALSGCLDSPRLAYYVRRDHDLTTYERFDGLATLDPAMRVQGVALAEVTECGRFMHSSAESQRLRELDLFKMSEVNGLRELISLVKGELASIEDQGVCGEEVSAYTMRRHAKLGELLATLQEALWIYSQWRESDSNSLNFLEARSKVWARFLCTGWRSI